MSDLKIWKINNSKIKKLLDVYKGNKEDLKDLAERVEEGEFITEDFHDVTQSFEQGYNNALELVFDTLNVKYKDKEEEEE